MNKYCYSPGIPWGMEREEELGTGQSASWLKAKWTQFGACKVLAVMSLCVAVVVALVFLITFAQALLDREEGQNCRGIDGNPGVCTLVSRCDYPGDFKRDHPPICSFKGFEPVICCPIPSNNRFKRTGHKLEHYCAAVESQCNKTRALYIEKMKDEITRQILGGYEALPMEHGHMALIGYGPVELEVWGCGGSLITSRYILSAAHCISSSLYGEASWVRLGDLNIYSEYDDDYVQLREIVQTIPHPGYKSPMVYNDIVLFKVDRAVEFTPWVYPVCIYTKPQIHESVATAVGFGRTNFSSPPSDVLLVAELDVFDDAQCRRFFTADKEKMPHGINSTQAFCAGKLDGSRDTCSGDSGGPLVINNAFMLLKTQIGITSFGKQCGLENSPGVYTRASQYTSWIEEIVFSEENEDALLTI